MKAGKPAIKSLAIKANLMGVITILALVREILVANPELIDDTKAVVAAVVALATQVIAIIGRWRAVVKVSGFLK